MDRIRRYLIPAPRYKILNLSPDQGRSTNPTAQAWPGLAGFSFDKNTLKILSLLKKDP